MNKAIFLDRDGTITDESCYPDFSVENCKLVEDNIRKVLKEFRQKGYLLVVVTNQAGIDRGYYTEEDFWNFMKELERKLTMKFDGIYFCPYHPDFSGKSACRKPNNGMFLQAQKDLNISLHHSFMIGDSEKDIVAGKRSGCKTILYNNKKLDIENFAIKPDFVTSDWGKIARFILEV